LFTKALSVRKFSTLAHIVIVHSTVEAEYLLQKFWHNFFYDTHFAKVLHMNALGSTEYVRHMP
jgi:hypothetical protein